MSKKVQTQAGVRVSLTRTTTAGVRVSKSGFRGGFEIGLFFR